MCAGRFYGRPGLDVAVAGAVRRLHLDLVNQPLPDVMAEPLRPAR